MQGGLHSWSPVQPTWSHVKSIQHAQASTAKSPNLSKFGGSRQILRSFSGRRHRQLCSAVWLDQLREVRVARACGGQQFRASDATEVGEDVDSSESNRMRCDEHTALGQRIAVLSTMNSAASTESLYQPPPRRKTRFARGSRESLSNGLSSCAMWH